MAMLSGLGVTLSALVIQGVAGSLAIGAIDALFARRSVGTSVWRNGLATLVLILILLAGHMTQVAVWATVFVMVGEFREFTVAFYHSAVNYTTLGYGDMVRADRTCPDHFLLAMQKESPHSVKKIGLENRPVRTIGGTGLSARSDQHAVRRT
jgi:hypothetical protein